MKHLMRLKDVELYKVDNVQSPDGDFVKESTLVNTYKCINESLTDAISATIYGADLNKINRFSSVNKEMEAFLFTKFNNTSDNISKYQIKFENNLYKIRSLTTKYVDCERI